MPASIDHRLWRAVDDMLARGHEAGLLAHRLGPLAAHRLRRVGRHVPDALEREERLARMAMLTSVPLLRRVRELVDGPILLVKGPEVACRYPGRARSFSDLDLIVVESDSLHLALKESGFVEVDDPELFHDYRHLRPLQAPGMWLKIEIHTRPIVPDGVQPPPIAEVVEAAVPSALGIEGISAPNPAHHALMLASHGWDDHEPLGILRDLIDVTAVASQASADSLERGARAWGIEGIWRTTRDATLALFGGGEPSAALRLFGRHLAGVRERTVLENHVQRWLSPYWALPFQQALMTTPAILRQELFPESGEPWGDKLRRMGNALVHPSRSMSTHTASWRRDGTYREDRHESSPPLE